MTTTLQDPVGRQYRERGESARRPDRAITIRYGQRREVRAGRSGPGWSGAERWALRNDVFIGEVIDDDGAALSDAPFARPGVVRLAAMTSRGLTLPGPVLIERSRELVDDVTLAVLAEYMRQVGQSVLVGPFLRSGGPTAVTAAQTRQWIQNAGGPGRVHEFVAELREAAQQHLVDLFQTRRTERVYALGDGPVRDATLAAVAAEDRLSAGWPKQTVREYLELYGFINPSGTVGRWTHDQFERLLAGAR